MPAGAWRHRRPLPVPPGMIRVQPIGDATSAEAEAYRAGRDGEAHPPGPRARPPQRNTDSGAVGG